MIGLLYAVPILLDTDRTRHWSIMSVFVEGERCGVVVMCVYSLSTLSDEL